MKNLKIKAKLAVVLTVFVLISTGSVVYSLINIKNQRADALLINLAGRQRALSQSISKSVLGLHNSLEDKEGPERSRRVEAYKKDILDKKRLFSETLDAFWNGGALQDGEGGAVYIPKVMEKELRDKLEGAGALWRGFDKELDIVLAGTHDQEDPRVVNAIRYVEDNNVPLFKDMNTLTVMFQARSDSKLAYFKKALYFGVALNLAALCVVIWLINRLVIKRLKELHGHMRDITAGEGDLTKRVEVIAQDEIGVLGKEFNAMLKNFEEVIAKLSGSCGLLRTSSERLNSTFDAMAGGIGRQDQKTGQAATAMEEMSATVTEVARNASEMTEMALNADRATKRGESSVNKVIERISEIAESTKKSVEVVSSLGEESQKIGNIVQVINEIADQTNLLALNAAIEAARAGEQGRGFAVVADEVRKLAERTTRATKEIDDMISGIQEESRNAVLSIEKESAAIEEGVVLTREAGSSLKEITGAIARVTDMIRQIATSTEEQSAVASSISADMETVANISRESSAGVSGVSRLAGELNRLAEELEGTLSRFKVSGRRAALEDSGEASACASSAARPPLAA